MNRLLQMRVRRAFTELLRAMDDLQAEVSGLDQNLGWLDHFDRTKPPVPTRAHDLLSEPQALVRFAELRQSLGRIGMAVTTLEALDVRLRVECLVAECSQAAAESVDEALALIAEVAPPSVVVVDRTVDGVGHALGDVARRCPALATELIPEVAEILRPQEDR